MCIKCMGKTKNKIIVLSDFRTSTQLSLENKSQLETLHKLIDGCVIIAGQRCDHYLKIECGSNFSHLFVELKGSDVEKAVTQIVTTVKSGAVTMKGGEKKYGVVVCTRNPLNSTETSKLKKKLLMSEGIHLSFHKKKAVEKLTAFT